MSLTNKQVRTLIETTGPSGHDIANPDLLSEETGIEVELLEPFVQVYYSDGTHKGSITDADGNRVDTMRGIYVLDMLRKLSRMIGGKTLLPHGISGRGFQAREHYAAIERHLDLMDGGGEDQEYGSMP